VNVIRVGLHPSEGLVLGEELIDGPLHSSFKELVLTEIWADLLLPIINKNNTKSIEIHVPLKELNYAIGYKSVNKTMLLQKFKSVKFIPDVGINTRDFVIK
jgi:hypothetical protein